MTRTVHSSAEMLAAYMDQAKARGFTGINSGGLGTLPEHYTACERERMTQAWIDLRYADSILLSAARFVYGEEPVYRNTGVVEKDQYKARYWSASLIPRFEYHAALIGRAIATGGVEAGIDAAWEGMEK